MDGIQQENDGITGNLNRASQNPYGFHRIQDIE
jgi:hypothetical protein